MDHEHAMHRAREVIDGLSVGDALGEALSYRFYDARELVQRLDGYTSASLRYTDDTELSLAIVETLDRMRSIDEEVIAWSYGRHFLANPDRGYGKMARRVLGDIAAGTPWKDVSSSVFGNGSFGNGGAMRVAPLGAYFADDLDRVVRMAERSARVTHYHPEGIAGAVVVAIASAVASAKRDQPWESASASIREEVLSRTPEGRTRDGLTAAFAEGFENEPMSVARLVGNGTDVSSQDTVPFCLWNACRCLSDYEEAIVSTVEVGGDCDTNAAIVGGVVSAYVGGSGIPAAWLQLREPLQYLSI